VRKKNIFYHIFTALFILFFTFSCYNTPPVPQEEASNQSATNRENNPPDHTALGNLDEAVARARTARQRAIDINVPAHYPMDWAAITTHFVVTEQQVMTSTLRETQEATARYYAMTKAFEAVNLKTLVMYANLQEQAGMDNNILSRYSDEISNAVEITASFSMPKNNEAADSDLSVFHHEEAAVINVSTLLPQTGVPVIPNASREPPIETPVAPPPQIATPASVAQRMAPAIEQKASETPAPLPEQNAAPAAAQEASETPAAPPEQNAAPAAVTQEASETPAALPEQNATSVVVTQNPIETPAAPLPQNAAPVAVTQNPIETTAAPPEQNAAPVAVTQEASETPAAPPEQNAAPVAAAQEASETPAAPPPQIAASAVVQKVSETPIPQVQSGVEVVVEELVSEIPILQEEPLVVEEGVVNNSALLNTEPEQVKTNNTIFLRLLIIAFSCMAVGCCVLFALKKKKIKKTYRSG